jgi:ABC-type glycerol-3-phosphate transport system substrate-binding protein
MGRLHVFVVVALLGACNSGQEGTGAKLTTDAGAGGPYTGQQAPPGPPVTLTMLRHDNQSYAKADDDAFADYSATHPNVHVQATSVNWVTWTGALNSDLKLNRYPYDLILMPPSVVCSFADNLADVPPEVTTLANAQQVFFPQPLAGSVCNGVLKGLPAEYNLEYGGVVVNLDRYQAKFGRLPNWPDWPTFIAEAAQLAEFDPTGKPCWNGLDISTDWTEPIRHILLSQILQRGGHYSTPDGLFDFNTVEARASMTEMIGWINVNKVMSLSLVPEMSFILNRLATGATGVGCGNPIEPLSTMGYVGPWSLREVLPLVPAGITRHYGYFRVPPMVGTEHKFVQNSGFAFAVPKTSKNAAAAWALAGAIALSPPAMKKWAATAGTLPALRANGTPEAAAGDPVLSQVQPLLEKGQWQGYIPSAAIEAVDGAIVTNFVAALKGTKTIDQALADMQLTANTAIMLNR